MKWFNFKKNAWISLMLFWLSGMIANIFNWLFNVVASHSLSLTDFGNLTLYLTFQYLISIFSSALYITTNRFTLKREQTKLPLQPPLLEYSLFSGIGSLLLYLCTYPLWGPFFNFELSLGLLCFSSLLFFFIFPLSWLRGTINALELYAIGGITILIEAGMKLLGGISATTQSSSLSFFISSLPFSMAMGFLIFLFIREKLKPYTKFAIVHLSMPKEIKVFYLHTLLLQVSFMLFLNLDVLLVKHYFSAEDSGIYSLLSLVGKTILFLGYSFVGLLTPYISSHIKDSIACRRAFIIIAIPTLGIPLMAVISFIGFPLISLKFLIGEKFHLITPLIATYSIAILSLIISLLFVSYHLLKERFIYPSIMLVFAGLEVLLIVLFHASIAMIVTNILVVTTSLMVVIVLLQLPKVLPLFRDRKF